MITQKKRILTLLYAAIICSLLVAVPVLAEESKSDESEIVFLLDTSLSMKSQDSNYLAIDAIKQMIYSIPSSYKCGVVTYGTQAETVLPLGIETTMIEEKLAAVSYSGYTNAGAGLKQAVDLFSDDNNMEQYIIMLSDGEIDMPDGQSKENSREQYVEAAKRAKARNIKIYIVAVGTEFNPSMHIFDGAELTDGAIYWQGHSGSLSNIMDRIVSERLKYPVNELETSDNGQFQIDMPKGASQVNILLSGSSIDSILADNGTVIAGKEFAVVHISRPTMPSVNIQLQSFDMDKLHAYSLTEYKAQPKVSVTGYTAEATEIQIELIAEGNDDYNLWQNVGYEGKTVSYIVNGMDYIGVIKDGVIKESIPVDGAENLEVSLNSAMDTKAIHYLDPDSVVITLPVVEVSQPEEPVKTLDYRPLCVILAVLAVAIAVIALYCLRKRPQKVVYVPAPQSIPPKPTRPTPKAVPAVYSGKLNIYMVKMPEDQDIPPQTFRLFGKSAEWMTLTQILAPCGIPIGRNKTDRIEFFPGPEHSLIVMDNSPQCTVYRGMEILRKGVEYPVSYNSKITVSFDDETEIEIHYQSLKPSERTIKND
ncbi:vWA domain-containing protein [Lacrimispora brassicae]